MYSKCRVIHYFVSSQHIVSRYSLFRFHRSTSCRVIHYFVISKHLIEMSNSFHCIYIYIYIYSEMSYSFFKSKQFMSSQFKSIQVNSSQFKSSQFLASQFYFSEAPSSWDVRIHMFFGAPLSRDCPCMNTHLREAPLEMSVYFSLFHFHFYFYFLGMSYSTSHLRMSYSTGHLLLLRTSAVFYLL